MGSVIFGFDDKQAVSKDKRRQQCEMEKAVKDKTEELQKTCREMTNVKADMECKNKQLLEMQRKNDEMHRTLKELKAECRRRDVGLTELRESGQKWLAQADRNADAVTVKLTEVRTEVADWQAKRERADAAHLQLKMDNDAETCRTRAALKVLCDEREKSNGRLADITCQLTAVMADNQRLMVASKNEADRLAGLTDKLDRLEQRKYHESLLQSLQRVKGVTEITLLNNRKAVKDHKLFLAAAEVEELRRTSSCCVQMTGNTPQELDEDCPVEVTRCQSTII